MDKSILSQTKPELKQLRSKLGTSISFDLNLHISLPLDSLDNMAVQLKETVLRETAKKLGEIMCDVDRQIREAKTRKTDGFLIKEKDVPRQYMTPLGIIDFKRTYYTLKSGGRIYLLDALLDIIPRERISRNLSAELVNKATTFSYGKAAEAVGADVSRQTVSNRIHSLNDVVSDVSITKKVVDELHIFADEDHVNVHTEKGKKSVNVPIICLAEGIDKSNPDRHKIKEPLYVACYKQSPKVIFDQLYALADRKYNLSKVSTIYIHADGGSWIKNGSKDVFDNAIHVMDEFHINERFQSMKAYMDPVTIDRLREFVMANDYDRFYYTGIEYRKKILDKKQRKRLDNDLNYFSNNWQAIINRYTRNVCGSCTESLVSHVLAERLSRTPCGWSEDGLDKMAMLRAYKANGNKVKGEDVNISIKAKADRQKQIELRKNEGYEKYGKYFKEAEENLRNWFFQKYVEDRGDIIIDVSGGVQQFIKRISRQNLYGSKV